LRILSTGRQQQIRDLRFFCIKVGEEVIRPDFNRAIMIDCLGARISSGTGFILLRVIGGQPKKNLFKRGWYANHPGEIYFFSAICAIMASIRQLN
jgi:hypothetical protein